MVSIGFKMVPLRLLLPRLSNSSISSLRSAQLTLDRNMFFSRTGSVITQLVNSFHRHCYRYQSQLQGQGDIASSHQQKDLIVRSPYPDIPIPDNISLSHLLLNEFPKYKNIIALVDGVTGQEMTFGELHTSVVKATSALVKLGLRKGDVVTIFSPNCIQYAIATIAITAAGATFSGVNPLYTAYELQNALTQVGSRFLITSPVLAPIAKDVVKNTPDVKEVIVFGEADGCRPFSSLLEDDMTAFPENIEFRPKEDIAGLPFSSGTTGLPKGVMLSHYSLVANIEQIREDSGFGYKPNLDCVLAVLPFYHIYGQVVVMLSGLFCGTKVVILQNFEPTCFLKTIQQHRPTYLPIVPPLLLFLAKSPLVSNFDISSVRQVIVGAAPVSTSLVNEFLSRLDKDAVLRQAYGMTEASPLTHMNERSSIKYYTAGPAVPNTKFKVIDLETKELLGPGKSGEVCIRGPQVMVGYYANKKATDETIVDGWLHTGDVGHYDEDGYLIIDDRIKEMIKVKGFQVAPAELEALLVGHPSVQDAAVIGVKDEKLGEAPKAFVVLKPEAKTGEEELKQYVSGKVAPFKRLVGGIEFLSEIPKSPSGKILRRILK